MSVSGILWLVCLIILRCIPEAITCLLSNNIRYAKDNLQRKGFFLSLFLVVSSGIHFAFYLFYHYLFFHTWNIGKTISDIVTLNFLHQNLNYFYESLLFCTILGCGLGLVLKYGWKRLGRDEYQEAHFHIKIKYMLLLSLSMMSAGIVAFWWLKNAELDKILINEVCSNQVSIFSDEAEVPCDYIELYNTGWLPYEIKGFFLSDDRDDLEKCELPNEILGSKEYTLVLLDENASFQVSSKGETLYLSKEGVIVDEVICDGLNMDTSYCRMHDGSSDWGTRMCTPGKSNQEGAPVLSKPVFSCQSGFYEEEFELALMAEEGMKIFYTLDGSIPTTASMVYEGPLTIRDASKQENVWSMRKDISTGFLTDAIGETWLDAPNYVTPDYLIDKCTVIRAICVDEEGNKSPVSSGSYFVGFHQKAGYQGMNVLSLLTDPDNLFDYNQGIYVRGRLYDENREFDSDQWYGDFWWWWTANYNQRGREWEREASLQFFDTEGSLLLTKDAGIRTQGGGSCGRLPRSMNFYARKEYDKTSRFEADFWGSSYEPQRMTLFAGGDDNFAKIKDYLATRMLSGQSFSTMDFEPYVLFLNGEYWGCYWLTEKYDAEYFEYHYNVNKDNVIMIKTEEVAVGNEEDKQCYDELQSFVKATNFSGEENYRTLCEMIDVDSFLDYYAAEIYLANMDWPFNNYGLWRTRVKENDTYSDGKWRWALFDVNSGVITKGKSGCMSSDLSNFDSISHTMESDPLFVGMMENAECRRKFKETILELAETELAPERVHEFLEEFKSQMKEPLKKEYERFYGKNNQKLMELEEILEDIDRFFEERYLYITEYFGNDANMMFS